MTRMRKFFINLADKGAAVAPPTTATEEEQAQDEQPGQEPATAKGPPMEGSTC